MTWYKTGTVSVTNGSNAVVGAGTSFIANARVGDGFRGPDGGWYEVTNIASNTAMSISPNYQGSTVSAGVYSLAPLQGYLKDSADALRAATQVIGQAGTDMSVQVQAATTAATASQGSATVSTTKASESASSATAANASKVAAKASEDAAKASENNSKTAETNAATSKTNAANSATAAANSATQAANSAASAANKAAAGANSDITSLSGLTTPLSILQGGNGGAAPIKAVTDNADSILTPGVYAFGGGGLGLPTGGTDPYYLRVISNSPRIIQEALGMSSLLNGKNYTRIRNAAEAWSPWVPYSQTPPAAAWGGITGALSAQTDLQSALDSKLASADAAYSFVYPNGGSSAAPANIAINTRLINPNPFPGLPVICIPEILVGGVWEAPGWFSNNGTTPASVGVTATQRRGGGVDDIITQSGSNAVITLGAYSGSSYTGATLNTPLPVRVKVWRLKG